VRASFRYDFSVTDAELERLAADFGGIFRVPENFEASVPPYNPQTARRNAQPPQIVINPQTTLICAMLGVTDPMAIFSGRQPYTGALADADAAALGGDDGNTNDSLDVDDRDEGILDDSDFVNTTFETSSSFVTANSTFNPDEISLDDLDDDDAAAEPPPKRPSFSPTSTDNPDTLGTSQSDLISDAAGLGTPDTGPAASAVRPTGSASLRRRNFAIYSTADNNSESD